MKTATQGHFTLLPVFVLLVSVLLFAITIVPEMAHATAAPTVTPVTIASNNASTTLAKVGDVITVTFTSDQTPLIAPTATIATNGAVVSGSGVGPYTATYTMASGDATAAAVPFVVTVGNSDGTATTSVTAITSGLNVRFDKTAPTLNSVVWTTGNDLDSSTEISGGDTFTFTFSEAMATTTLTAGTVTARLGLNHSHTFGTTGVALAWNSAWTVLTLTLGSESTVADGDTFDPSTLVTDLAGNADATVAPVAVADGIAPLTPTFSPNGAVSHGAQSVVIASTGASGSILYSTGGTSLACPSTGTVYSGSITITTSGTTLTALGCDTHGNQSSLATSAIYSQAAGGSGGSSSSSSGTSSSTTGTTSMEPASPATTTATAVNTPASSSTTTTELSTVELKAQSDMLVGQIRGLIAQMKAKGISIPLELAQYEETGTVSGIGKDLQTGSKGDTVVLLQKFLISKNTGAACGALGKTGATGMFGAQTRAALAEYQKAAGITPANGYFGPRTRSYLESKGF